MAYSEYKGNLFNSEAQTLVNTVNCVGVMGKGVALEFKRRFPDMYQSYRNICDRRLLKPGQILPYRHSEPWILNFAIKGHWRHPSKLEWIESCLIKFCENYERLGVTSIAFPWMGAMNGGLPWNEIHTLMIKHLQTITDIDIEVVEFAPDAPDPIYKRLKQEISAKGIEHFANDAKINLKTARLVSAAIHEQRVSSITHVSELPKVGKLTLDNIYSYLISVDQDIT